MTIDQNWIRFDGEPAMKSSLRMRVSGGELSPEQAAWVAHEYGKFCAKKGVSIAQYFAEEHGSPDGARVRFVSINGEDFAHVVTGDAEQAVVFPHGFGVIPEWAAPFIYGKLIDGDAASWVLFDPAVPQLDGEVLGSSHVLREGSGDHMVLPMVLTKAEGAAQPLLFNYVAEPPDALPVDVLASPPVTPVPQIIRAIGLDEVEYQTPHYIHSGSILAGADGAVSALFEHSPPGPILLVEPEPPKHLPADISSDAGLIVLRSMRSAVIAPTGDVGKIRFKSDAVKLIDGAYVVDATSTSEVILAPTGADVYTTSNISDNQLGEDPSGDLSFTPVYSTSVGETGAIARIFTVNWDSSWNTEWVWNGHVKWGTVIGDRAVSSALNTSENATRTILSEAAADAEEVATIYAATSTGYEAMKVSRRLAYPRSFRFRSGTKSALFNASQIKVNEAENYFAVTQKTVERRDSQLEEIGSPEVKIEAWSPIRIFYGTTSSVLTGKAYVDKEAKENSLWNYESSPTTVITPLAHYKDPNPQTFTPGQRYELGTKSLAAAQASDLSPFLDGVRATYTGGLKVTSDIWEPPENTAEYDLSSQYVLDYDHKACFWSAIKVRVVSSGAKWGQVVGGYRGNMEQKVLPSYTVTISFESEWKNPETGQVVKASVPIHAESCTRVMFEAVVNDFGNPYRWPLDETFFKLIFQTVPRFAPPFEIASMFERMAEPQSCNPCFVGADHRPDLDAGETSTWSDNGIEFSSVANGAVYPHTKRVRGMLYARTFALSDFTDALWLLKATKCDAPLDGAINAENPELTPPWHYLPLLRDKLDEKIHIELRDGIAVNWSDDIEGAPANRADRVIQLFQV